MRLCSTGVAAALLLACCSSSHATVLYDGSLATLPADQEWHYLLLGTSATESLGGGAAILDTTAVQDDLAGYFSGLPPFLADHPGVGVLDSSAGFVVRFNLQLVFEEHSGSTDRAGFSVIVLDSSAKGVELGFWADEIWAQDDDPLFTHSTGTETATFDTTAMTQYDLSIQGGTYWLSAGGPALVTGALKDYSDFDHTTVPGLPADPYEMSNFLFFGDNTTSASATVGIAMIELIPIPEPASVTILLVGCAAALARRRRRGA